MSAGTTALTTLMGGAEKMKLALVFHVRDYMYALSLGRPVSIRSMVPEGSSREAFGRAGRHVRAVAVTNDASEDWGDVLPPWSMVEIGPDASVEVLSLA